MNQLELVAGILQLLGKRKLNERQINAVIAAANTIMAELERRHVPARTGMGLDAWLRCDETGMSSMALAYHLAPHAGLTPPPVRPDRQTCHPHDPSDFGRCLGLLEAAPELRPHLPHMAGVSSEWGTLVAAWSELEALYREESPSGKAPKLYARMKELLGEK